MVLIISSSKDYSTIEVVKWLKYLNKKFIIINEINKIVTVNILFNTSQNDSINLKLEDGCEFNLNSVKSVWYRRGDLFFAKNYEYKTFSEEKNFNEVLLNYVENEIKIIKYYIFEYLKNNCFNLSDFHSANNQNKLIQLSVAKSLNLTIPESLITSKKSEIISFYEKHNNIISKPLSDGIFYFSKEENVKLQSYTKLLNKKTIQQNKSNTHSLFQDAIDKSYEVRTFYLLNKSYSIAIYSQSNKKTKIDYRDYDYINPNYCKPYILPKDIEKKVVQLMKKLNLNNGSIDFIKNTNGQYVFLEVNPVGQFGNVSDVGGYNLELLIAKTLTKYES